MIKNRVLLGRIIVLIIALAFSVSITAQTIRIACIGNSITYGAGIENREKLSYPAQLQCWLGDQYEVRNFGVSGATLLNHGNKPYRNESAFQDALSFNPDIVLIKLGTNDSKPVNWAFKDEFVTNYEQLIGDFNNLPSKPRILLALPVPVFTPEKWGIRDSVVTNEVIPMVKEIGKKTKCEIIDLYTPLLPYPQYFPDQIHPNSLGAAVMVQEIYVHLFHKTSAMGGGYFNTATFPVPSPEYRGAAAGWGEGKDWYSQHEAINSIGENRQVDLVFFGNSITQSWGGEGREVWSIVPDLWDSLYKPRNAANFGISGDRTQHLLWRIANGNFDHIQPQVIVLAIGVNNFPSNTAQEIAEGISAIVNALRRKVPNAKILLLGPFPTGKDEDDPWRIKYHLVQQLISPFGNKQNVRYLNIGKPYILSDRTLNYDLMRSDNVHLAPAGYVEWANSIETVLKELMIIK